MKESKPISFVQLYENLMIELYIFYDSNKDGETLEEIYRMPV